PVVVLHGWRPARHQQRGRRVGGRGLAVRRYRVDQRRQLVGGELVDDGLGAVAGIDGRGQAVEERRRRRRQRRPRDRAADRVRLQGRGEVGRRLVAVFGVFGQQLQDDGGDLRRHVGAEL